MWASFLSSRRGGARGLVSSLPPNKRGGAERRETQGFARPLERPARPPDTLGEACPLRVRSGEAPLGAPLAAISDPGSALPGPRPVCPRVFKRAGSTPERALRAARRLGRPCPASSSQRGRNAPRSGPGTSRVRGYEPRPQAPHRRYRLPGIGPRGRLPDLRHPSSRVAPSS